MCSSDLQMKMIDELLAGGLSNQGFAIDKLATAPGTGLSDGDSYLIYGTPGGGDDWEGYEDYLAEWDDDESEWTFTAPTAGMYIFVQDEQKLYYYDGTQWTEWPVLDVLTGDLTIAEYIKHLGDLDTFMRFETDLITLNAGGVEFLRLSEGASDELVVNEAGVDVDFRVEGVGAANALFVQGSNGYTGIGTASPLSELHLYGASDAGMIVESYQPNIEFRDRSTSAHYYQLFADTNSFSLKHDAGHDGTYENTRLAVDSSGNLTINSGDLTVGGNDILNSASQTMLTFGSGAGAYFTQLPAATTLAQGLRFGANDANVPVIYRDTNDLNIDVAALANITLGSDSWAGATTISDDSLTIGAGGTELHNSYGSLGSTLDFDASSVIITSATVFDLANAGVYVQMLHDSNTPNDPADGLSVFWCDSSGNFNRKCTIGVTTTTQTIQAAP